MGLATAKEAAHPDPRLFWSIEVRQVGLEDVFQPPGILSLTDEGLQLVSEGAQLFCRLFIRDDCHAVVEQKILVRVFNVDFSIFHGSYIPSAAVMGTDR